MRIDLHYGMDPSFGPDTHETRGCGGTENFIIYSAEYLARLGHKVRVYNKIDRPTRKAFGVPNMPPEMQLAAGVTWYPLAHFDPLEHRDVLMSFRTREVFETDVAINADLAVLALADTESHGLGEVVRGGGIDLVIFVSQWQADKIRGEEKISEANSLVSSNGIAMERFDAMRADVARIPGKCIHLATPERGLNALLDIWPLIQKRVPMAELHLFSSFQGWGTPEAENESMCHDIYARIDAMIDEGNAIINHKHAPAAEIRRHLLESQLYLYPTRYFNETCCISALEAAAAGVPIIATARAALNERVQQGRTGYLVREGARHDEEFTRLVVGMLYDQQRIEQLSAASVEMARRYDYTKLVWDWSQTFKVMIGMRK